MLASVILASLSGKGDNRSTSLGTLPPRIPGCNSSNQFCSSGSVGVGRLAWGTHKFSTAVPQSSVLIALRFLALLDVLDE